MLAIRRLYAVIPPTTYRIGLAALLCSILSIVDSHAQSITANLNFTKIPPSTLLATRSVVLYDYTYTQNELTEIQGSFQNIGIDPIAYFEIDKVFAGQDTRRAFADYFTRRQITYVVVLEKENKDFQFTVSPFDQKLELLDSGQVAWRVSNERVDNLMLTVWQDSWASQKKQNFLINDHPETDIVVDIIPGKRGEFYAIDLKVDNLAVIKFGDEEMDKQLEEFFLNNYPMKYKIVEAGSDEKELRKKGFHYVLCFVNTRGSAAKEVLGYDMSKDEKNYVSITFPEGQLQLKVLPGDKKIYKFYFRHIDNGNVFLGTKWDADDDLMEALRNHILGFKQEARIN